MLVVAAFGVLGIGSDNEFMASLDGDLRCSNTIRVGYRRECKGVGTNVLIILHETGADLRTFLEGEVSSIYAHIRS